MALFGRQIGGGAGGAMLTAEEDGSFSVLSPTVDVGTGTHTIVQQIVASEMEVPLARVSVRPGDTDTAPFDEGPRASRVTYTEGQAVLKACAQLKAMLADGASLPLTVTIEHDAPARGRHVLQRPDRRRGGRSGDGPGQRPARRHARTTSAP